MTILTRGDQVKTQYDDLTLSRVIGNSIHKIHLDKRLPKSYPLELLHRLNTVANLDQEDFKALSLFQGRYNAN